MTRNNQHTPILWLSSHSFYKLRATWPASKETNNFLRRSMDTGFPYLLFLCWCNCLLNDLIAHNSESSRASLVAQLVKNPSAMRETCVQSLGWEDPLEKGKATHSSILACRILYSPWGHKKSDTTEQLSLSESYNKCYSCSGIQVL